MEAGYSEKGYIAILDDQGIIETLVTFGNHWANTDLNDTYIEYVAELQSGNFICVGSTKVADPITRNDAIVILLNSSLEVEKAVVWNHLDKNGWIDSVVVDQNSDIYVCGDYVI